MAMMLLEAAVAGHLLLNEHWMQDLPYDRTRELENLVSFVNNNLDLCKWAALATVATQAFSLFLAITLRAMVSSTNADFDSDEDFVVIRRPLLLAQGAPAYLPTTADPRGAHPGLWSSSMRQKYGLNSTSDYTYNTLDQNAVPPQ
ncbi:tetraspanin-18-like [Triticum dicoccoides]|nr:tetraspanin-18-like [Triticum dicoccoides]